MRDAHLRFGGGHGSKGAGTLGWGVARSEVKEEKEIAGAISFGGHERSATPQPSVLAPTQRREFTTIPAPISTNAPT